MNQPFSGKFLRYTRLNEEWNDDISTRYGNWTEKDILEITPEFMQYHWKIASVELFLCLLAILSLSLVCTQKKEVKKTVISGDNLFFLRINFTYFNYTSSNIRFSLFNYLLLSRLWRKKELLQIGYAISPLKKD
jgi:hypothetical protein